MPALLTAEQVAAELGMCIAWVYRNRAEIGFIQMGRAVRFEPSDVEMYRQGRRRGPEEEGRKWESQSDSGAIEAFGSSKKRTTVADVSKRLEEIGKGSAKRASSRRSA